MGWPVVVKVEVDVPELVVTNVVLVKGATVVVVVAIGVVVVVWVA